jgi:AcrR family transcriptional regulator
MGGGMFVDVPARDGSSGTKPVDLRRDAERNRQRILRVAADLIAERGLAVTLDEVAAAAGVGVGTVYRRFPGREALVAALFEDRLGELVDVAERAIAEPDPWIGLDSYLEQAAELLITDRGLREILMFGTFELQQCLQARDRLRPLVTALVKRAQAAGAVRPDLNANDVSLMVFMLIGAADYARPVRLEIWRRYLALLLDGLPPNRNASLPLAESALSGDELEQAQARGRL